MPAADQTVALVCETKAAFGYTNGLWPNSGHGMVLQPATIPTIAIIWMIFIIVSIQRCPSRPARQRRTEQGRVRRSFVFSNHLAVCQRDQYFSL
jgi:hypothetical protein